MHSYSLLSLLSLSMIMYGCSGSGPDQRLIEAERLIAVSPQAAVDSLRSIDYHRLSDADRHHYDFLSVKAADKAYITHASDSLILSVIDYESRHKGNGRYPEALYYGGRVYSDLGDYPTALKYFQDALDIVTPESNMNLRGNILSQTGRQLNCLRLYEEAIPYFSQALHIDSIENDTFCLAYDHQLMGSAYLRSNNPELAKEYFYKAMHWAMKISPTDSANMRVYLAAAYLASQQTDSALTIIRHLPDKVSPLFRNLCLAYACDIYLKAGVADTAYTYALQLVQSADQNNKKSGYQFLLSPSLLSFTPTDSLINYIREYRDILEEYYNSHKDQHAVIQNAFYNYQIHERLRLKSEAKLKKYTIGCFIGILITLFLIITTLIYRIQSKQNTIRLHESISRINYLQQLLDERENCLHRSTNPPLSIDVKSLRNQLKHMLELLGVENRNIPIPQIILNSDTFQKLQRVISSKSRIVDSDPLWEELLNLILEVSPDFKIKLHHLIGEKIKTHEMQTIILIKYGVTPIQMTDLLGLSKGGVSSRRESLCRKIIGEKINSKGIDNIIRSL